MTTRFKFIRNLCILFFGLLWTSVPRAEVISFFDRASWAAALPDSEIDTVGFDGARLDFAANSSNALGLLTIDLLGGNGDPGPTGLAGNGFLQGEVDADGADALALTLRFPKSRGIALLGLQNDSLSSPANLDLAEIALEIGDRSWILGDLSTTARNEIPFLGFVADFPIDSFTLFHAGLVNDLTRSSEEFYLDGLMIATRAVSEPALAALLMLGLTGLVFSRRPGLPSGRRSS